MYILKEQANQILEGFKERRQVRLDCVFPESFWGCSYHQEMASIIGEEIFVLDDSGELYGESGMDPRNIEVVEIQREGDFQDGDEMPKISGTIHFTDSSTFEVVNTESYDLFEDGEAIKLFSAETVARWDAEIAKEKRREEERREAESRRVARGERSDQLLINGVPFPINKSENNKLRYGGRVDVLAVNAGPGQFKVGEIVNAVYPFSNSPTPEEQFQVQVTGFTKSGNTMFANRVGQEGAGTAASAQTQSV